VANVFGIEKCSKKRADRIINGVHRLKISPKTQSLLLRNNRVHVLEINQALCLLIVVKVRLENGDRYLLECYAYSIAG